MASVNHTKLLHKVLLSYLAIALFPLLTLLLVPASADPPWLREAAVAACALAVTLGTVLWARSLDRRLRGLSELVARAGSGDLSSLPSAIPHSIWPDETDRMREALERMRASLTAMLHTVKHTSRRAHLSASSLTEVAKHINVSAGEIARSMDEMAKGATLQSELVGKTSTLMNEVSRSIAHTSRSAEDAARSSTEASVVAQSGSGLATKAVDKMRSVFEEIERFTQRVLEFGDRTKEIGNIVRVITEVAQQTHLLAISATIEAARAGEAGRGFAVVAEEIRQLAENTSRSAERIAGLVEEVTRGSQEAAQAARTSTRQLNEGRDQLAAIVDSLRNIVSTVTAGTDRVQIISRLTREQIAGAEQTVKAFENISRVSEQHSDATAAVRLSTENQSTSLLDVTRLAQELVSLADALDSEVRRFSLPEEHHADPP